MTPIVIDDFLPADDYKRLLEYVQSQPMLYGSKSNSRTDPHGHWSWKPIHDHQKNLADLTARLPPMLGHAWTMIKQTPGLRVLGECAVIRSYANGHTYGMDGYFHTDSDRPDERTIILYMCDRWEPDWGGETVCGKPMQLVLPAPNRALIISSDSMHCARAVSRKCTTLRTTLMYKTRPLRSLHFEAASAWLVKKGALNFPHQSGTLHDHLMRVWVLLRDKDSMKSQVPVSVRNAGGIHSIYGTNHYQQQLIVPTAITRGEVADVFGKEAEALAYLFSSIDRPGAFERPKPHTQDTWGLEMRHDHVVIVDSNQLRSLQLIEAANLLDQNSLDKWPNLKRIWENAS